MTELPYRQSIETALNQTIAENGVSESALNEALGRIPAIAESLKSRNENGELSVFSEPFKTDDLEEIERIAKKIQQNFSHLVVMGTGGSSLGALTLCSLTQPRFGTNGLSTHFVDNTDPNTMEQLFTQISLSNSFFLFVSKSGNTVETMMQAMLTIQQLEAHDLPVKEHCLAVSMPGERALRKMAAHYEMEILDHDPELGGRFSVLSLVGLLPAAAPGLNIQQLRAGAKAVMESLWEDAASSAPAIGAALNYTLSLQGKSISVVMPYVDRLQNFGRWYQQLWGESVGKEGKGTTAVGALGAVDQHSQLQLYAEGPKDKLITFITLENAGKGEKVDASIANSIGMEYLGGLTIGDVIDAQAKATQQSLINYGVATRHIALKDDSEFTLGALLQHYMMETALMAGLMEVDAFNQPGVEESKQITREIL
jgi:glucose-6-phosphate isomerase